MLDLGIGRHFRRYSNRYLSHSPANRKLGWIMPEVDGKITLRLDDSEAQVLFWALINRVRQLSDERRANENAPGGADPQEQIETEIIQCGALLERLPTYRGAHG
jgi:hypothetical protein